jgi:DNA polymerase III epsilon subunit-like protein
MKITFVDTETSGLLKKNVSLADFRRQPGVIQLAYLVYEGDSIVTMEATNKRASYINPLFSPDKFTVEDGARKAHGISDATLATCGKSGVEVYEQFLDGIRGSDLLVGHNIDFDRSMLVIDMYRYTLVGLPLLFNTRSACTMQTTVDFCGIPRARGAGLKFPKLQELHSKLFGEEFKGAHDALEDISATARCFFELVRRNHKPILDSIKF